ncbi:hypothetical protein EYF80_053519 [Liparis tanakae]|uniref:Secreted protein n=1 Tax=Liparis tanakae TaxID=230148 RepID=A0A4Z2F593_9TELE|nr:hypothetical protein EYF80_053519 [Liparis tanakae]
MENEFFLILHFITVASMPLPPLLGQQQQQHAGRGPRGTSGQPVVAVRVAHLPVLGHVVRLRRRLHVEERPGALTMRRELVLCLALQRNRFTSKLGSRSSLADGESRRDPSHARGYYLQSR